MKLTLVLFVLIGLMVELSVGAPPSARLSSSSLDPYGRVERNSRMSKNNYPTQEDEEQDDEDEDEDNDEENDEQDDDVYPPDFAKLFPNPDGRPVGPQSGGGGPSRNSYGSNHPLSPQPGRPSHGPASSGGPAALRGPIQAQHGQRQGGMIGGGRPSHDPPPPSYRPTRRGPPPQRYRHDIDEVDEDEDVGRGLPFGGRRRVVGPYPMRRIHYPTYSYGMRPQRYVLRTYPTYRRPTPYTRPSSMYGRREEPWNEDSKDIRSISGRVYNPWSQSPLQPDAYNPRFVFNPTEMRLRRRFRYHPSQRIPSQRISLYDGEWGNPRNTYSHQQTGDDWSAPNHWSSQF